MPKRFNDLKYENGSYVAHSRSMKTRSLQSYRPDHVWAWTTLMGVLFMALGCAVIAASAIATIAISWFVGLCLILGGFAQLFHTYRFPRLHSPTTRFIIAAISVIVGVILLRSPIVGAIGITLSLAIYLLFSAVTKAALAYEGSQLTGRSWLILSSIVSFLLGVSLFVTLPFTSLVIPGTLLGVDFIFYGVSITAIAGHFRNDLLSLETTKIRRIA